MNEIQFEIGGELRGFKFGLGFLGDIQKHFDIDLIEMEAMIAKNPLLFLPAMLYYGHKHDCIRNRKPVDFEIFHFEDWITELEGGVSSKHITDSAMAMRVGIQHIMGVEDEEAPKEGSKKK